MRRLLGTLLVPAALLATATTALADTDRPRPGPEVVAHRGASADAPENTLAAADGALAQRADAVEVDVQRTADGHLVLVHDATLARTTDVERVFPARALAPVGSFTLAELRRLDAGSWFSPAFAGERIPTLAEFGDRLGGRADLLIELKDPARYPGVEKEVGYEVDGRRDVVVQSFDHDAMRRFTEATPDVPAGWLFDGRPTAAQLDDAVAHGVTQINPSFRDVDSTLVADVRARGMQTGVYTVNDPDDMRRTARTGVDRIITDRPAVLREVLGG
ncbi:glycerophosphodiester phosphodiesterase family protein [Pseudonocardia sp. ICBG1293]|uniref:glycerophosphodiester phosphodiesterase n=1 Tax=Pseudonocardia sp. ICBG1293 TaxID=2844382 RepID=UPI001CCCF673|nr:glycerophosphodiester phosphodiesterase family protein [Pseudonocardia sp. ICBG1293]